MPKMKSKRGACKRFKVSGKGKIMRHRANRRHILTSKSRKRKRILKRALVLEGKKAQNIAILLQQ